MPAQYVAELRSWHETTDKEGRPVFQGRVFNDITHLYRDGQFVSIEAHDVSWTPDGDGWVTDRMRIYALWKVHKRIG